MDFGRGELPAQAREEDLTTLFGRLRAAMVRAGKTAKPAELEAMLKAAGHKVNRQTPHNWFRPSCKFIEPLWLFRVAKVLDVSPEWLSTGDGPVAPPQAMSDDRVQVIEMWESLPTDKARQSWISSGHQIIELVGKSTRSAPFKGAHAEIEAGERARRKS